MENQVHGRRYSPKEKGKILEYLETHTYKETCSQFNISEPTIARWKRAQASSVSDSKSKIIITISHYWLDYLNEKIQEDIWADYSTAVQDLLKHYARTQVNDNFTQNKITLISKIQTAVTQLNQQSFDYDQIAALTKHDILFQSNERETPNKYQALRRQWKRALYGRKNSNSITLDEQKYIILSFTPEQIVFLKQNTDTTEERAKNKQREYICGVRRKIDQKMCYFFMEISDTNQNIMISLANLQRIVYNLPAPSSEHIDKYYNERRVKIYQQVKSSDRQQIEIKQARTERLKEINDTFLTAIQTKLDELELFVLEKLEAKIGLHIPSLGEILESTNSISYNQQLNEIECSPLIYENYNGHIVALRIRGTQLAEIPEYIKEFKHLNKLDLRDNKITTISEAIKELTELEDLYLDNNQITQFPDNLRFPQSLINLDLSRNTMKIFPPIILELNNLRNLDLQSNEIGEIPRNITNLTSLRHINLMGNKITKLPKELKQAIHSYMIIRL